MQNVTYQPLLAQYKITQKEKLSKAPDTIEKYKEIDINYRGIIYVLNVK